MRVLLTVFLAYPVGCAIFLAWINSWPACKIEPVWDRPSACRDYSGAAGVWPLALVYMAASETFSALASDRRAE